MDAVQENLDAHYERYWEILQNLTLMSDPLMRNVLKVKECVQYVLQIILGRKDLVVIDVTVQKDFKNLHGRSVILDVLAVDEEGNLLCIEIQQNDKGASPMRARFISGLIDMNILDAGGEFEELPEVFTIFLTKNDVLKGRLPIYHIERRIEENGKLFGDHAHIIYVNSSIQDDTELGRLMHDFHCKRPDDMYSSILADRVRALKEPSKEGKEMCEELEKLYREGMEKGRKAGREEGREEGIKQGIEQGIERGIEKGIEKGIEQGIEQGIEKGMEKGMEKGIEKGIFSSIKNLMISLGFSLEESMNALRIPENERGTYIELLAGQQG